MNLRTDIREHLKRLKFDFGVVAIKAEFEAEGSRKDELIMLRELVEPAGLGLVIKIGGCEAVHDIDQCKLLDATGIMAPMIETTFALRKFRKAVDKIYGKSSIGIEKIINAETITCYRNFDEILAEGQGFLTGITVGRGDLSASMGIEREHIEEKEVFDVTKNFCENAKQAGLIANFGGNIGVESVPFIMKMDPFIDRFETRKVILRKSTDSNFLKKAIIYALEFELLYLRLKSEYYTNMANEDSQRIIRLERQINSMNR